jgi:hypothetical protein
MLELEIQKLTAAITALTEELRSAKVGNSLPTENPTNLDKLRQDDKSYREDDAAREKMQAKRKAKVTKEEVEALVEAATPVENTECADQPLKDKVEEVVSAITADDLKTVAMEIARSDSSARPLILSILSLHGAKTITQLDPKHYQEVHAELMSIAYDIAKNGEVTQ